MTPPEITVVIPVRNRQHDLERCLSALISQTFSLEQFEIIVCDDGSTDLIFGLVESFRKNGLNVFYLRQNPKGPAAARNLGISFAAASIIAMTDSDTLPNREWLSSLYETFSLNSDVVGVEGKVISGEEGEAEFEPTAEAPSNTYGGVYLTCNCAYRLSTLIAAGGFDEKFPYPAYEDTELAARAKQLGKIIWQPKAVVVHPKRPLTLHSVLKKLRHWEYVMLMGFRYGYLGWSQYPVTYPRIRILALSFLALPVAKVKLALFCLKSDFTASIKLLGLAVTESLGSLLYVIPKMFFLSYKSRIQRRCYLNALSDRVCNDDNK